MYRLLACIKDFNFNFNEPLASKRRYQNELLLKLRYYVLIERTAVEKACCTF